MTEQNSILEYLNRTIVDSRINKTHLSLMVALFYLWSKQGFQGPLVTFSKEVMPLAKIASYTTYHSLVRQLDEYGYIRYEPSFYKKKGSKIYLKGAFTSNYPS